MALLIIAVVTLTPLLLYRRHIVRTVQRHAEQLPSADRVPMS